MIETLEAASVLFSKNPLPMWVYDPVTLAIVDVNEAAVRSYGWSRREFLAMTILGLRPDDAEGRHPSDPPVAGVETHLRRDGSRLEAEVRSSRIDLGGRPAVLLVAEDATHRLAAQRELRALVHRALNVREEEQARIAREIHDSLGQTLAVLKMELSNLRERVRKDAGARAQVDSMAKQVDGAVATVREIAAGLHPALIDQLGLPAALEWFVEHQFGPETGLSCRVEMGAIDCAISPQRAIALYRIVQEALANVVRHARATSVHVTLSSDPQGLCLRVTDDGVGISPEDVLKPRSLGLIGMRERAQAFGGTLKVEGAPGFGTRVEIRLPVDEASVGGTPGGERR